MELDPSRHPLAAFDVSACSHRVCRCRPRLPRTSAAVAQSARAVAAVSPVAPGVVDAPHVVPSEGNRSSLGLLLRRSRHHRGSGTGRRGGELFESFGSGLGSGESPPQPLSSSPAATSPAPAGNRPGRQRGHTVRMRHSLPIEVPSRPSGPESMGSQLPVEQAGYTRSATCGQAAAAGRSAVAVAGLGVPRVAGAGSAVHRPVAAPFGGRLGGAETGAAAGVLGRDGGSGSGSGSGLGRHAGLALPPHAWSGRWPARGRTWPRASPSGHRACSSSAHLSDTTACRGQFRDGEPDHRRESG